MTWLQTQLAELKDFLSETSGKLAAAASAVAGTLAFVSSDPSVALLFSELLPGPIRYLFIVSLVIVAYILPHWAKKKDEENDETTAP